MQALKSSGNGRSVHDGGREEEESRKEDVGGMSDKDGGKQTLCMGYWRQADAPQEGTTFSLWLPNEDGIPVADVAAQNLDEHLGETGSVDPTVDLPSSLLRSKAD